MRVLGSMTCLVLAVPAALAQTAGALMPEGSREGRVGVFAGLNWKEPGSKERASFVFPYFSMQWSHGAFVEGTSAGWELSDDPGMQYGPLLTVRDTATGGSQLTPGAFARWSVLHDVVLHGRVGVGLRDGKPQAELAASWLLPLDADHHLTFSAATQSGGLSQHRLAMRWDWRLGRRYTLIGAVTGTRLAGGSAAALQAERRSGLAWSAGVVYSF